MSAPVAPAAAAPVAAESEDRLLLEHAEVGKVQTRFPPEASGFLHIGHAKALLINRMLADKYQGKMLFRFDDTNPDKEKHEFELAIIADMKLLGVKEDIGPTYSSDFFDKFIELAEVLIRQGDAYTDKTEMMLMREQRFAGIESAHRNNSVEENLRVWGEMLRGTEEGQKACLRAKISMTADNKALRDPVMFRVNLNPHARTKDKYKCYPMYDFCCPIIDSLEGVTHALRTNEYHDRNAQYFWVCDALKLRKPWIQDFSRLNMEYTLMSKRKLTMMVEEGVVDGWDDPRFPTVRGLLRRGMSVTALREFVKVQGMSKVVNLMEWSKLWAFNNVAIDPIAPRYYAVDADRKVLCNVVNFVEGGGSAKPLTRLRHKKNEALGEKTFVQGPRILLDSEDVLLLADGEEVTLMDWGNAFVRNVQRDEKGQPTTADIVLNPTGDFKKTKSKLSWVADIDTNRRVLVKEFEHLLLKKKPEGDEEVESIYNKHSLFTCTLICEAAFAEVRQGQFLQIERRGFYIVDKVDERTGAVTLHSVPSGSDKLNHLSAKVAWMKANPELAKDLPCSLPPVAAAAAAAAASTGASIKGADAAAALEEKRAAKAAKKDAQKGAAPAAGAAAAPAAPAAAAAPLSPEMIAHNAKVDAQALVVKNLKAAGKGNADEEVKAEVAKLLALKANAPKA